MKFSLKHKYGAKTCKRGDISFDSKLERSVWDQLENLRHSGKILFTLRQVPIHLTATKYLVDFLAFTLTDCYFLEVKAASKAGRAPVGELKRKQAEEILGVQIHVVTDPMQVFGIINHQ